MPDILPHVKVEESLHSRARRLKRAERNAFLMRGFALRKFQAKVVRELKIYHWCAFRNVPEYTKS